jgi:preprotein translocase subunit SecE
MSIRPSLWTAALVVIVMVAVIALAAWYGR